MCEMKILLVTDANGWCIENRCKAIKKFLPEHEFEIVACKNDFSKDYDIIHFNYSFNLGRHIDFIKRNGYKCVITFSNERSIMNGDGGNQKQFLEIMDSVSAITSVSKTIADNFPQYKITYIPNGIDEDIFNTWRNPIVGYAGSQNRVKNFHILCEACSDLDLELKTTGEVKKVGDRVVSNYAFEDMQGFYNSIDVLIHASQSEGCSNTILEALSCNIPVLMTKTGIWQDLEGYVTFIEPTVESIKDALKKFMGRSLIEEKFLWKNIIPRYNEVYEEVLCLQK